MTRAQAKKLRSKKIKFECVFWDWREQAPIKDIVKYARKYKYALQANFGDDQYYVFFSNQKLTNKLCEDLWELDMSSDCEDWEWDDEETQL